MSLYIAVVEDDPGLRELLVEELESAGYVTQAFAEAEALLLSFKGGEKQPNLVISDIRLPGISGLKLLHTLTERQLAIPLILITAFGTVDQAVDALKQGADDFLTKPLDLDHLLVSVERVLEFHKLRDEVSYYRQSQQDVGQGPAGIIGNSRVMRQLYDDIERIAAVDGAVLVLGESGTGKELVAKAVHQQSQRAKQPFLAVNCAGIPAELLESEFFGHAAGAFTGAQKARAGLLKEADGGTLLLDEIGEMPLELQAKLLRVLQEGTMRPVGSDKEERVNVRIIAATHQDLEQKVTEQRFREDLFYRLETFTLKVPPLRHRGDDIAILAEHFLQRVNDQQQKAIRGFSSEAQERLFSYSFPGNVRELQNAVERAVTFCDGDWIQEQHLPTRMLQEAPRRSELTQSAAGGETDYWPTLDEVQSDYVQRVLTHTQGNKQKAANILGVTRRTLYRWLTNDD